MLNNMLNLSNLKIIQSGLSNVPIELMTYFEDLIKTMDNWEEETLNYLNIPNTNTYTESLNRLIKTMNHVDRGYSFEALRAKILFAQGYRKVKKRNSKKLKLLTEKCYLINSEIGHKLATNEYVNKFKVLIFPHYFTITRFI